MRSLPLVLAAAALLSCTTSALAAAPATQAAASDHADPGEANVALARSFLTDIRAAMASRSPERIRAVIEHYMAPDYVQHATMYGAGREGFINTIIKNLSAPPRTGGSKDLYFVGNQDFVCWLSETNPGVEPSGSWFNMFRVVNGKFQEHWQSPHPSSK